MLETQLETIGFPHRLRRAAWRLVWMFLYRPTPVGFHAWRRVLLRLFGAAIEADTYPYPSVQIWAPWNLQMRKGSCIGPHVKCYNVAQVSLEERALVSQYSHICTASHDYNSASFPLTGAPIRLQQDSWVAADVFVGPGVTIEAGAVALGRAVVTRDVAAWTVVAGNPAKKIRMRRRDAQQTNPEH